MIFYSRGWSGRLPDIEHLSSCKRCCPTNATIPLDRRRQRSHPWKARECGIVVDGDDCLAE